MSLKSRVAKLEDQLRSDTQASVCSREQFDDRVERIKHGYERFGYQLSHEEAILAAHEWLTSVPCFEGFGFDLAEVGLSNVSHS